LTRSRLISELLEAASGMDEDEDGSYSMDMAELVAVKRESSAPYTVQTPRTQVALHKSHGGAASEESLYSGQMREMYQSVRNDLPVSLHMVSDITMSFDSSMLNNPFDEISMQTVSQALRPVITNTALLTSFHEAEHAMIAALSAVDLTDWTAQEVQDAEDRRVLSLLGEKQSFPGISRVPWNPRTTGPKL
jgi:hypothetical protein